MVRAGRFDGACVMGSGKERGEEQGGDEGGGKGSVGRCLFGLFSGDVICALSFLLCCEIASFLPRFSPRPRETRPVLSQSRSL